MQPTRLLSADEFEACFAAPIQNVTENAEPIVDIWPYVDNISLDDLGLPDLNDVHHVYRDAHGRFDQILIGTGRFNTLLVIVVDRHEKAVLGHRLLDLNREFGTGDQHLKSIG